MALVEFKLYETVPLGMMFMDNYKNFLAFNLYYDNADKEGEKRLYGSLNDSGFETLSNQLKKFIDENTDGFTLGDAMSRFISFNFNQIHIDKDKKIINDCIPVYWDGVINTNLLEFFLQKVTEETHDFPLSVAKKDN